MCFRIAAIMLSIGALAATAKAEIKDLLPRVPADANAIVAIDVPTVLNSPVAKTQGWGKKPNAPLFLQPNATKILIAADVNLATLDPAWEIALMELNKDISMPGIALAESGVADTLGTLPAMWSSRHAYFIAMDKQLLGVSTPDDRRFAVRWAKHQTGATKPVISTYLQDAALQANTKTGIVMALDLTDAIGLNKARRALMSDLSRAALLKDTAPDNVAVLLTSLRGVSTQMQFGNEVSGQIALDFDKDPAILLPIALPLLKDVLTQNGLPISDLDTWTASSQGKKLIFTGKFTVQGFMSVMSLLQPPSPGSTTPPPAAPATPTDPQAAVAAASQAYFKAVSSTLDGFSQTTSAGEGAAWLKRASARIDHLPLVNVDPELVRWGNQVSASLLNGAQQLAVGQTQISAASAGAKGANTVSVYTTDDYGNYSAVDSAQARAAYTKQAAAMVQASQAERARVTAPVAQLLSEMLASRSKIRAIMVERYKVEF